MRLIDRHRSTLQSYITKYLTDIGCGNGKKAIELLEGSEAGYTVVYLASDYSASMIDLAEKNILEKIPGIKLGNHQIMRPGNGLLTNSLEGNTYFWVGWTIGNFLNNQDISNQIKNMSNSWTLKWNRIILSYFDAPKTPEAIEKTENMYRTKEVANRILNGVQNIGIDTTQFECVANYNPSDTCVYVWIKAKEDVEIILAWRTIHIKKWEIYNVIKSKRFSLEEIKVILKQSWAKLEDHFSDWDISLIVAKKDPKYFHKTMKIAALTSLLVAGTLAGWIWEHYISQQKQKAENTEFLKKNLQNKWSQKAHFDNREREDPDKTFWTRLKIDQAIDDFYNDFLTIYWSWSASGKDLLDFKDLMKQHFLQADTNGILINLDKVYDKSIIQEKVQKELKIFVSSYAQYLFERWFNVVPYNNLQQYKDACTYTSALQWNIVLNHQEAETWNTFPNIEIDSTKYQKEFDNRIVMLKKKWMWMNLPRHSFNYQKFGNYLHSNGDSYDVLFLESTDNKKFLVAHKKTYEETPYFDRRQIHMYTKQEWEIVAKDFLAHRAN